MVNAVKNRSTCGRDGAPLVREASCASYARTSLLPGRCLLSDVFIGKGPSSGRPGDGARLPGIVSNRVLYGVSGLDLDEKELASDCDRPLDVDVDPFLSQSVITGPTIGNCATYWLDDS